MVLISSIVANACAELLLGRRGEVLSIKGIAKAMRKGSSLRGVGHPNEHFHSYLSGCVHNLVHRHSAMDNCQEQASV
jgi:hypothetical protein